MKNYKDYDDFLRQYESHKEKHDARSNLFREEGFREMHDKYGQDYNVFDRMDDGNDPMNEKYNMYRARFYERYWDTQENHDWYA